MKVGSRAPPLSFRIHHSKFDISLATFLQFDPFPYHAPMPDDRPLRILHLTGESDAGGLSQYLFNLCTEMHARGHQVAIAGQRGFWHHLFKTAPWPWID